MESIDNIKNTIESTWNSMSDDDKHNAVKELVESLTVSLLYPWAFQKGYNKLANKFGLTKMTCKDAGYVFALCGYLAKYIKISLQ